MSYIKRVSQLVLVFALSILTCSVHARVDHGLGQTIQINTHLTSFVGRPSWLITIRDVDNNQTIPYLFDITQNDNFWLIFTYGKRYLIVSSDLQIPRFHQRYNDYTLQRVKNFCNLESNGRIIRGESLVINIAGDLKPGMQGLTCQISRFNDPNFYVYDEDENNT